MDNLPPFPPFVVIPMPPPFPPILVPAFGPTEVDRNFVNVSDPGCVDFFDQIDEKVVRGCMSLEFVTFESMLDAFLNQGRMTQAQVDEALRQHNELMRR